MTLSMVTGSCIDCLSDALKTLIILLTAFSVATLVDSMNVGATPITGPVVLVEGMALLIDGLMTMLCLSFVAAPLDVQTSSELFGRDISRGALAYSDTLAVLTAPVLILIIEEGPPTTWSLILVSSLTGFFVGTGLARRPNYSSGISG